MTDIDIIRSILPSHYTCTEVNGGVNCKSELGIRKDVDAEDPLHWSYVMSSLKMKFGQRFKEVYHQTNLLHKNFTVYLS